LDDPIGSLSEDDAQADRSAAQHHMAAHLSGGLVRTRRRDHQPTHQSCQRSRKHVAPQVTRFVLSRALQRKGGAARYKWLCSNVLRVILAPAQPA